MENLDPLLRNALLIIGALILGNLIGRFIGHLIKKYRDSKMSPFVRALHVAANIDKGIRLTAAGLWIVHSQLEDRDDVTLEDIISVFSFDHSNWGNRDQAVFQQVKTNFVSLQKMVAQDPSLVPRLEFIPLAELEKTDFDAIQALQNANLDPVRSEPN